MKKSFMLFLLLFLFSLGIGEIKAQTFNNQYSNDKWSISYNEGKSLRLCGYTNSISNGDEFSGYIEYIGGSINMHAWSNNNLHAYRIGLNNIWNDDVKTQMELYNFRCPNNAYIDTAFSQEMCFDNNGTYCLGIWDLGTGFKGTSKLEYNYEDDLESYFQNYKVSTNDCAKFEPNSIVSKFHSDFSRDFLAGNELPTFIKNNLIYTSGLSKIARKTETIRQSCISVIKNDSSYSDEERAAILKRLDFAENEIEKELEDYGNSKSDDYQAPKDRDNFGNNCADFAQTLKIGGIIMLLVKIIIPIIIIIRSVLNMISVVTSGSTDDLKKQARKIGISIMAAILIFFVPTLVDVAFGVMSNATSKEVTNDDADLCRACIFRPLSDDCSAAVEYSKACMYGYDTDECKRVRGITN